MLCPVLLGTVKSLMVACRSSVPLTRMTAFLSPYQTFTVEFHRAVVGEGGTIQVVSHLRAQGLSAKLLEGLEQRLKVKDPPYRIVQLYRTRRVWCRLLDRYSCSGPTGYVREEHRESLLPVVTSLPQYFSGRLNVPGKRFGTKGFSRNFSRAGVI